MKNEKTKRKFNCAEFALKKQKAVFAAALILAGLWLAYALIFSTPFYGLSFFSTPGGLLYVEGAEIYRNIQPFNKTLLNIALIQIVLVAAMFVYFAGKRRIYYLSNYISIGVYAAFSSFVSVYSLINIISIIAEYSVIDFDKINAKAVVVGRPYTPSYYMPVIGILLCLAAMALTAFIVFVAVTKYRARQAELRAKNELREAADVR